MLGLVLILLMIFNFCDLLPTIIMLLSPKQTDLVILITSNLSNPWHLWKNVNRLHHRNLPPVLPASTSEFSLSHSFATFFSDKIYQLHISFLSHNRDSTTHITPSSQPFNVSAFHHANLAAVLNWLNLLILIVTWIPFQRHFSNIVYLFFFPLLRKSLICHY
jgi:hypothetical protein